MIRGYHRRRAYRSDDLIFLAAAQHSIIAVSIPLALIDLTFRNKLPMIRQAVALAVENLVNERL